jgi:hypothetical protein
MKKLYWFLPLYTQDDLRRMIVLQGLEYPLRSDIDGQEFWRVLVRERSVVINTLVVCLYNSTPYWKSGAV